MAEEEPGNIRSLPPEVVNKIAAGEVVQRPVNVVKELIENSLDAGATTVAVKIAEGGLKLISVTDNGKGIPKEDFGLLCQRHATSKLSDFSDLARLCSYGFRGEALASVSQVAQVSVLSRTAAASCAHKASFVEGKLGELPRPCAGLKGSQIRVAHLFGQMPSRRSVLKYPSEEHRRIEELLKEYAVENPSISFSLQKEGQAGSDFRTPGDSTAADNVRLLYGKCDLIPLAASDSRVGYRLRGLISAPSYARRVAVFLLFVNGRRVSSSLLRHSLQSVIQTHLPPHASPIIYLSLQIPPHRIDVNVHPTKQEVKFLNEADCFRQIADLIDSKLSEHGGSRKLSLASSQSPASRSLAPSAAASPTPEPTLRQTTLSEASGGPPSPRASAAKAPPRRDHQLVRTDYRSQKLDVFLVDMPPKPPAQEDQIASKQEEEQNEPPGASASIGEDASSRPSESDKRWGNPRDEFRSAYKDEVESGPEDRELHLTSLIELRQAVGDAGSPFLRDLVKKHSLVGILNDTHCLIQYSTALYLIKTSAFVEELFYQVILFRIGKFGEWRLSEAASLEQLLRLAPAAESLSQEALAQRVAAYSRQLRHSAPMLADYFRLRISEGGQLETLPHIISGFPPPVARVGELLWRLGSEVEWELEKECLSGVARVLGAFYGWAGDRGEGRGLAWRFLLEHTLLPALRAKLLPPTRLTTDNSIRKLTDLKDLYKIFERC